MYSRVHIPPHDRCTKFENFLHIICRDIPHFVNFSLILVRLSMTLYAMSYVCQKPKTR